MQKLWLYLYFPQLQLDSLLQQGSATHNQEQAYIVIEQANHQICQLNSTAYQAGIQLNMGLGTAAMLKNDLKVILYQENINQGLLNDIAHNLYMITSDICLWKQTGLLLQIQNMLTMYGGLTEYWQIIQQHLPSGIKYHYATGYSPLAAQLLAENQWDHVSQDQKKMYQALHKVPLSSSSLAPKVIKKLARVGIHTIQALLKIPFADLAKRFDIEVTNYIAQLTNQVPHPVDFFHPKKNYQRYLELLFDNESIHTLIPPLNRLLTSLENFLKHRDLLTHTLVIQLYQREQANITLNIHAPQGEYLAKAWLPLIKLKLENIELQSPVYGINLSAPKTHQQTPEVSDLFSHKQNTLNRLQLQAILQAKLGEQALSTPTLVNDFRPELNACMIEAIASNQLSATPSGMRLQAMRPSFLLTAPQPLQEKVSIAYGPERLNTAWWDRKMITRDYYIARNPSGQWYWIYKTPAGHWYLHGVFS